jgi:hypothetical protein
MEADVSEKHAVCIPFFRPENGDGTLLRNFGFYQSIYKAI